MVKLNKIYTRTGDDGSTGLVGGERRQKDDVRVCAYGDVDEANAQVGQARLFATNRPRLNTVLQRIQNDLFDVGSDLANPVTEIDPLDIAAATPALRVTQIQIDWLEQSIDNANEKLQPLTSFVLPGGSQLACALHVARTIVRRAERQCVTLGKVEPTTSDLPKIYLNRLSDLLFVLARSANDDGKTDILWQPGLHSGSSKGL